ncbi:MAG TPA: hypothetical protein ENI87_06300 [bacterium]|nr:hypothetical protein [bacterium]
MLPLLLLLLVAGFYGYQWWQERVDRAAARARLIADAATELDKPQPDRDRLSSLMARLTRLPDAATSPELLALQAEIELLRGRPERADEMFLGIATSPGATPAQQRLGARILLRKSETFAGDAAGWTGLLEQVLAFSERAYSDGRDAADLFRAWQAATRLWNPRKRELAAQLAQAHPDSAEHRLVALVDDFDPARDATRVADLFADFATAPYEVHALRTAVTLQKGDVPAALAMAERDLNLAPGVPGIRYVMAIVLHACALASKEGSVDRIRFADRRDRQLDWLEQRAPADEPQRQQWQKMRAVR